MASVWGKAAQAALQGAGETAEKKSAGKKLPTNTGKANYRSAAEAKAAKEAPAGVWGKAAQAALQGTGQRTSLMNTSGYAVSGQGAGIDLYTPNAESGPDTATLKALLAKSRGLGTTSPEAVAQTAMQHTAAELTKQKREALQSEIAALTAKMAKWRDSRPLAITSREEAAERWGERQDAFETPAKLQQQITALQKQLALLDTQEGELQVMGEQREQQAAERQRTGIKNMTEGERTAQYLLGSYAGGLTDWSSGLVSAYDAATPDEVNGQKLHYPYIENSRRTKRLLEDGVTQAGKSLSPGMQKYGGMIARGTGYSTPSMVLSMMPGVKALGGGKGIAGLLRNPLFWTSAIPMYGSSYSEALSEGANEGEAQAMALMNGFAGAVVEIGGGVEQIPRSLPTIRTWLKGLLDEGKEEVIQGVIEQLAKKITYDREWEWNTLLDNELFSLSDDTAVINPARAGEEFLGGALVGGVLGGAQTLAGKMAQQAAYVQLGQEYTADAEKVQQALAIGLAENARGTDAYIAAQRMAEQVEKTGKAPSAAAIGRMLAETATDEAKQKRRIEAEVLRSAEEAGADENTAADVAAVAVRFGRRVRFFAGFAGFAEETATDGGQYSIVTTEDGKTYVTSDRNVLSGTNPHEWRKQITQFFDGVLLENGSLTIDTIDGDTMTITKKETVGKGKDKHVQVAGRRQELTNEEYYVKLQALSHIDELTETASFQRNGDGNIKTIPDTKSHSFARDGFAYPTVYFEDANGDYYQITLSVGMQDGVGTVYNIGKMQKTGKPTRAILSVIGSGTNRGDSSIAGSKALGLPVSDTTIPQNGAGVNTQYMQKSTNHAQVAGMYDAGTDTVLVNAALTTDEAVDFVLKHELTHAIEGSKDYAKLEKLVRREMGEDSFRQAAEQQARERLAAGDTTGAQSAEKEVVADWIGRNLYKKGFAQAVAGKSRPLATDIYRALWGVRRALGLTQNGRMQARIRLAEMRFADVLESDYHRSGENSSEGMQYSLRPGAREEVKRVLAGEQVRGDVQLTDSSPSIIVEQKGARNLPLMMKASHIRENVFSEAEAAGKGLRTGKGINYHGLGENLFLQVIDNLNDVTLAYRGTKNAENAARRENYFLLVSQFKDGSGNIINVPVYINETGQYNEVFIETNKIATVFGKNDFYSYVQREIEKGNLVKIKRKGVQASERKAPIANGYSLNTLSDTNISQEIPGVNTKFMQNSDKNSSDGQKSYLPTDMQERERAAASQKAENTRRLAEQQEQAETAAEPSSGSAAFSADGTSSSGAESQGNSFDSARVSQAKDWESIVEDIGESETIRRIYRAEHAISELGDVEIDGKRVPAKDYIDRYSRTLPTDRQSVRQLIRQLETEQKSRIADEWSSGGALTTLPIDLQLFAAKEQLMLLEINEDGKKRRKFIESRLKGQDATNSPEYLDYLSGRQDTYDPIGNQQTLEEAKRWLRDPSYSKQLKKRLTQFRPGDMFTLQDMAAAQVMINDAITEGDFEQAVNLTVGISRKATEAGRAVQTLSMQARLTPEGTLRSVKRMMQQAADSTTFSGMSEQLEGFAHKLAKQMETAAGGSETTLTPSQVQNILEKLLQDMGGSQQQLKTLLRKKLKNKPGAQTTAETSRVGKGYLREKLGDWETVADLLTAAVEKDGFSDATIKQTLEEQLELPTLNSKDVETIVGLVQEIQKHSDFTIEQAEAIEKLYDYLGKKLPVSKLEQWQAWRKMSMLANPKTHIRNMVSNVCMAGVQKADTVIGTLLENLFVKDRSQRSALIGWSLTEHGRKIRPAIDQAASRAVMEMQGTGKYDLSASAIRRHRQYFKTNWLNWVNETNSNLLEKEDVLSFRPAYKDALGQLMTVREATTVTEELHQMAMQRALEATFRAENAMHDAISSLKNTKFKSVNTAMDVIIPFSKTPANIMVETVMHSPIGLVKATADLLLRTQGKSGKSAANICNEFAKGLTGTVLMAIGLLLGHAGLFTTKYAGTEKERDYYELEGLQENSLRIGRVSISLDWLQPTCAPLILGASLGNSLSKGGLNLSQVFGGVMDATDSLFELTMLQSLYDVAGGYDKGVTGSMASVLENLMSQSIPTLVGQTARLIDPVQRRGNQTSALTPILGDNVLTTAIQEIMLRIPGLTYLLEPEMDVWGETVYRTGKKSTGSAILNGLQQILSPANIKVGRTDDPLNAAIASLYSQDGKGHTKALPSTLSHDKAKELGIDYTTGYRALGSAQRAAAQQLISNAAKQEITVQRIGANGQTIRRKTQKYWKDMTEEERLNALAHIYRDVQGTLEDAVNDNSPSEYRRVLSEAEYKDMLQRVLLGLKKKEE